MDEFFRKGNLFTIQLSDRMHRLDENPFDILKAILASCRIDEMPYDIPFSAGLMGYLSYDLKDYIEKLPRTSIDDLNLPVIFSLHHPLYSYMIIVRRSIPFACRK
jgi:para-aminobenzoate synthetase component 1